MAALRVILKLKSGSNRCGRSSAWGREERRRIEANHGGIRGSGVPVFTLVPACARPGSDRSHGSRRGRRASGRSSLSVGRGGGQLPRHSDSALAGPRGRVLRSVLEQIVRTGILQSRPQHQLCSRILPSLPSSPLDRGQRPRRRPASRPHCLEGPLPRPQPYVLSIRIL